MGDKQTNVFIELLWFKNMSKYIMEVYLTRNSKNFGKFVATLNVRMKTMQIRKVTWSLRGAVMALSLS